MLKEIFTILSIETIPRQLTESNQETLTARLTALKDLIPASVHSPGEIIHYILNFFLPPDLSSELPPKIQFPGFHLKDFLQFNNIRGREISLVLNVRMIPQLTLRNYIHEQTITKPSLYFLVNIERNTNDEFSETVFVLDRQLIIDTKSFVLDACISYNKAFGAYVFNKYDSDSNGSFFNIDSCGVFALYVFKHEDLHPSSLLHPQASQPTALRQPRFVGDLDDSRHETAPRRGNSHRASQPTAPRRGRAPGHVSPPRASQPTALRRGRPQSDVPAASAYVSSSDSSDDDEDSISFNLSSDDDDDDSVSYDNLPSLILPPQASQTTAAPTTSSSQPLMQYASRDAFSKFKKAAAAINPVASSSQPLMQPQRESTFRPPQASQPTANLRVSSESGFKQRQAQHATAPKQVTSPQASQPTAPRRWNPRFVVGFDDSRHETAPRRGNSHRASQTTVPRRGSSQSGLKQRQAQHATAPRHVSPPKPSSTQRNSVELKNYDPNQYVRRRPTLTGPLPRIPRYGGGKTRHKKYKKKNNKTYKKHKKTKHTKHTKNKFKRRNTKKTKKR
jgi:hypothetical protein